MQELENIRCSPQNYFDPQILQVDQRLARLFTTFNSLQCCPLPLLNPFCARFSCLTTLEIAVTDTTLVKTCNTLASLTQLYYLQLCLLLPEMRGFRWHLPAEDHIPSDQIAQLSSVKILAFSIKLVRPLSHVGYVSRHFGWIFPNIQTLFTGFGYSPFKDRCLYCAQTGQSHIACITRQLEPWVEQCPKLTRLKAPGDNEVLNFFPWQIRPLRPFPNQPQIPAL